MHVYAHGGMSQTGWAARVCKTARKEVLTSHTMILLSIDPEKKEKPCQESITTKSSQTESSQAKSSQTKSSPTRSSHREHQTKSSQVESMGERTHASSCTKAAPHTSRLGRGSRVDVNCRDAQDPLQGSAQRPCDPREKLRCLADQTPASPTA